MGAGFSDDCAAVGVPDEDNRAILGGDRSLRHEHIVFEGQRGVLRDVTLKPSRLERVVDALPTGTVDETAVDQDHISVLSHRWAPIPPALQRFRPSAPTRRSWRSPPRTSRSFPNPKPRRNSSSTPSRQQPRAANDSEAHALPSRNSCTALISGGEIASPPERDRAGRGPAGRRGDAAAAQDVAPARSHRSGSHRTSPRRARSSRRSDGPRFVRAASRAARAIGRSSRCARKPRTAEGETTTRRPAHTLRTPGRSVPPSDRSHRWSQPYLASCLWRVAIRNTQSPPSSPHLDRGRSLHA